MINNTSSKKNVAYQHQRLLKTSSLGDAFLEIQSKKKKSYKHAYTHTSNRKFLVKPNVVDRLDASIPTGKSVDTFRLLVDIVDTNKKNYLKI